MALHAVSTGLTRHRIPTVEIFAHSASPLSTDSVPRQWHSPPESSRVRYEQATDRRRRSCLARIFEDGSRQRRQISADVFH